MRDHPNHGVFVLGGMWGVKLNNEKIRQNMEKSFHKGFGEKIFYANRYGKQPDQEFLSWFVWLVNSTNIWFFENYNFMNICYFRPWARKIAMVHDSYLCQKYKDTSLIRPFPTQRESSDCNFVGCIPELKPSRIDRECPKECRPANHQNWTTC